MTSSPWFAQFRLEKTRRILIGHCTRRLTRYWSSLCNIVSRWSPSIPVLVCSYSDPCETLALRLRSLFIVEIWNTDRYLENSSLFIARCSERVWHKRLFVKKRKEKPTYHLLVHCLVTVPLFSWFVRDERHGLVSFVCPCPWLARSTWTIISTWRTLFPLVIDVTLAMDSMTIVFRLE
jgi:hypothetical protein